MKWTPIPPVEDGWYWVMWKRDAEAWVGLDYRWKGREMAIFKNDEDEVIATHWLGPLIPPSPYVESDTEST